MASIRRNKIAYAFGALGTALAFQAFNNRVQFLYIDELGLDPGIIGIIWFIYGIWNAINDPLMGQLSDNTRTQHGRRIPYIRYATLPLAAVFVLVWLPPRQVEVWMQFAFFVLTVFTFDTLWTLVVLAWTALFPEMWPDANERAAVSGLREVFTLIGVLLALGLSPILIDQIGWLGMALGFGVVTALSFFVSLLGSHENPAAHEEEEQVPFFEGLRIGLSNASFRWFLVANTAKEFLFLIITASLPFYAKYVLRLADIPGGMDAPTQESVLLATPFVLSIPAMFIWTRITQRVGSRRGWIFAALALLPGLAIMFAAPNFGTALAGTALMVLGLPGMLMISNIVVSDVIDEDELQTHTRREGFFFGINGAIIRLAFSVQAILFSIVLPLSHYDPALAQQPASAVWGFRFLTAGGPLLACLVIVWAMFKYPLQGEQLARMREELAQRRRTSPA